MCRKAHPIKFLECARHKPAAPVEKIDVVLEKSLGTSAGTRGGARAMSAQGRDHPISLSFQSCIPEKACCVAAHALNSGMNVAPLRAQLIPGLGTPMSVPRINVGPLRAPQQIWCGGEIWGENHTHDTRCHSVVPLDVPEGTSNQVSRMRSPQTRRPR